MAKIAEDRLFLVRVAGEHSAGGWKPFHLLRRDQIEGTPEVLRMFDEIIERHGHCNHTQKLPGYTKGKLSAAYFPITSVFTLEEAKTIFEALVAHEVAKKLEGAGQ